MLRVAVGVVEKKLHVEPPCATVPAASTTTTTTSSSTSGGATTAATNSTAAMTPTKGNVSSAACELCGKTMDTSKVRRTAKRFCSTSCSKRHAQNGANAAAAAAAAAASAPPPAPAPPPPLVALLGPEATPLAVSVAPAPLLNGSPVKVASFGGAQEDSSVLDAELMALAAQQMRSPPPPPSTASVSLGDVATGHAPDPATPLPALPLASPKPAVEKPNPAKWTVSWCLNPNRAQNRACSNSS